MAAQTAAAPRVLWEPNAGPQTRVLASSANEVLYGGAAGGGKSAGLVALPLRWVHAPKFRALVLRRETTDLGNLLDQAHALYPRAFPGTRAKQTGAGAKFQFPSGATVWFNHCQHEKDAAGYDGFEFQLVEFDELTHFVEKQYRAIRARIRSTDPTLPRFTRSTTNPGGPGHEWVFRRWGPWLDPDAMVEGMPSRYAIDGRKLPPALPGQVLYYVPTKDGERWVPKGTPESISRTFIPAKLSDNPHLLANDPGYVQQVRDLDPVRRAQLEDGNWLIKPAAGHYFKRQWIKVLDEVPWSGSIVARCRYWDLAGSRKRNKDADYAVGVKLAKTSDGLYVVEHVARGRGTPGETRALVRQTCEIDGPTLPTWIEQDPGQAGADQVDSYVRELDRYTVRGLPKRIDKISAAGPISAQAQAQRLAIVRAPWNQSFLDELESFPEGDHDDQVDSLSGAAAVLLETPAWSMPDDAGYAGPRRM